MTCYVKDCFLRSCGFERLSCGFENGCKHVLELMEDILNMSSNQQTKQPFLGPLVNKRKQSFTQHVIATRMFNSIFQTSRAISNNSAAIQPIAKKTGRIVAKYVGYSYPKFREKILLFRKVTGKIQRGYFFLGQSVYRPKTVSKAIQCSRSTYCQTNLQGCGKLCWLQLTQIS